MKQDSEFRTQNSEGESNSKKEKSKTQMKFKKTLAGYSLFVICQEPRTKDKELRTIPRLPMTIFSKW